MPDSGLSSSLTFNSPFKVRLTLLFTRSCEENTTLLLFKLSLTSVSFQLLGLSSTFQILAFILRNSQFHLRPPYGQLRGVWSPSSFGGGASANYRILGAGH